MFSCPIFLACFTLLCSSLFTYVPITAPWNSAIAINGFSDALISSRVGFPDFQSVVLLHLSSLWVVCVELLDMLLIPLFSF